MLGYRVEGLKAGSIYLTLFCFLPTRREKDSCLDNRNYLNKFLPNHNLPLVDRTVTLITQASVGFKSRLSSKEVVLQKKPTNPSVDIWPKKNG